MSIYSASRLRIIVFNFFSDAVLRETGSLGEDRGS